jgi:hypothetical protein
VADRRDFGIVGSLVPLCTYDFFLLFWSP